MENNFSEMWLAQQNSGFDKVPADHPIRSIKFQPEEVTTSARKVQTASATIFAKGAIFYTDLALTLNIQDGSKVDLKVGIWGPCAIGASIIAAVGAVNFSGDDLRGKWVRVELAQSIAVMQVSFWLRDGTPVGTVIGAGIQTNVGIGGGEGVFR